jgi:hypothetical protein
MYDEADPDTAGPGSGFRIPISTGIPPIVKISTAIGLLVVLLMLCFVASTAPQGHVWPAENSLKVKL